jgi:hypothetical protein
MDPGRSLSSGRAGARTGGRDDFAERSADFSQPEFFHRLESGGPGQGLKLWPWIPACARMTEKGFEGLTFSNLKSVAVLIARSDKAHHASLEVRATE